MRSMLYPLFIFLPVISFAAEVELSVGSGYIGGETSFDNPLSAGIAVSAGKDAGVRYGASFRGATYGDSNLSEQRIGVGVSYRFPLSKSFFWEPLVDVAYIEYSSSSPATVIEWRDGYATALSAGMKAGYRAGRMVFGVAIRQQFTDAKLNYNMQAVTACVNCTGINNIVYSPYAGITTNGRDTETEDAFESSTWLEASVGVAF